MGITEFTGEGDEMVIKDLRLTNTALMFLSFLIFSSTALAGSIQLPQTGQATTYSIGDDGDIRSGVPWPNPRFSSGGTGCRTDNLTGLTWAQNGNLPNAQLTWEDALAYIITLNAGGGICGHSDWRLPNVNELATLINANETNSASWLNAAGQGFSNVQAAKYWTSTTYANLTWGNAWAVDMWEGGTYDYAKTSVFYILPVRGTTSGPALVPATGQTVSYSVTAGEDGDLKMGVPLPTTRFQDNGDGTATDELTGLVWLKDANCIQTHYSTFDAGGSYGPATTGQVIWERALDFIDGMNAGLYPLCDGGHHDWRLPNRNELRSLVNYESKPGDYYSSLISTYGFSNIESNLYWSSTTRANNTGDAWVLNTGYNEIWSAGKTVIRYLWPVRSAPKIQVSPQSFDYGGVYQWDTKVQTFTVSNQGSADLSVYSLEWPQAAYFVLNDHCSGALLAPSGTCIFDVAFSPSNTGGDGSLFIHSNDSNKPSLEVLLQGVMRTDCSYQPDQGIEIYGICDPGFLAPYPHICDTIQNAYNNAVEGDTIKVRMISFTENDNFNLGKSVTLQGGYDCMFYESTYYSTIMGSLTITTGETTIANIIVR